jgi:NADH-quinone oxidoreductase subunit F
MTHGADELCDQMENRFGPEGAPCLGRRATWQRSACLGLCERAPAVLVAKAGVKPQERVLAPATVDRVESLIKDAANDCMPEAPDVLNPQLSVPQEGSRKLNLLRRVGKSNATQLDGYQRLGGYEALRKAIGLPQSCWAAAARRFRQRRSGKRSIRSVIG